MAGGVCLSNSSDARMFATEGPDRGVIETILELMLWHVFRRIETVLSLETPSSHVKLAQAKVERCLTLLCRKGDHRLYDLQFYFLFYASMLDISTVARNRTISHNINIVFSLGGHRLEGSPIWPTFRTYRVSHILNGVLMRLGSASLAYADMALLNS